MVYHRLIKATGWTFDAISALSLYQAAVILGGITPEHDDGTGVVLDDEQGAALYGARQWREMNG